MEQESKLGQHISKKYNENLEKLRDDLLAMGGTVEQQLKDSLNSLVESDLDLAKSVMKRDHEINQLELKITAECVELIALRQPTAGDLRFIFAAEKFSTDLERIGDLAQNIAKFSKKLITKGVSTRHYSDLHHVGDLAQKMLRGALDALARSDAEAAITVMEFEKKINRESTALSRQLITYMMEDPRSIKQTLRVWNTAKALERIAAHCENLCEYTVYLVKGEDIRYQNLDDIRSSIFSDEEDDE